MAKSRKLSELQQILERVQATLPAETAISDLQQTLKSKYAVVVARGAKLVGECELMQLVPTLVQAFDRFMVDPIETDPSCLAKASIADTLYRLECAEAELFLQGIRHFQLEPVWGGRQDTAPKLRGICALGLVRMHFSGAFIALADLLADPEVPARVAAVRAVAYSENPERGIPLLRLRVRTEEVPEVLVECFMALLSLAPQDSLPLVADYLQSPQAEVQEGAALVLGESRLPEAFPILQTWWERTREPELRSAGLLAIALLRSEEAVGFLLELLAEGAEVDIHRALPALELYRADTEVWEQIGVLLARRGLRADPLDTHA